MIAHSVTVMTVQAGAARLLLDSDPGRARAPLLVVEETGRQALADMRRLVGIVQDDQSARPHSHPSRAWPTSRRSPSSCSGPACRPSSSSTANPRR